MWRGIDVSEIQGSISWEQVKEAGCEFAVLRSVKRSGKADRQFAANVEGCRKYGIPFEVYRYTCSKLPTQAAEEAVRVTELLQGYGLSCRVWWDVEDASLKTLEAGVLTGLIRSARNIIEGAGLPFGIYTGLAFYQAEYFDASAFGCPFWIAHYPSGGSFSFSSKAPAEKYRPQIAQTLAAWQYTSRGRIRGIDGMVDLDLRYLPPG